MKLKKLLALTLTGAMLTASLTACTPLDAAEIMYDAIFGGGGSSSTGGNNGSTGGNEDNTTGSNDDTTGGDATDPVDPAEEAMNRRIADAHMEMLRQYPYWKVSKYTYGGIPEMDKVKALFKPEWATKVSDEDTAQLKNILSAYMDSSKYDGIFLGAIEVKDGMTEKAQDEALEASIYRNPNIFVVTSSRNVAEVWIQVAVVKQDGKTYRIMLNIQSPE